MKLSVSLIAPAILALSAISGAVAQSDDGYEVPRTEWGQPDLNGVWNFSSDIPMQRPERYGDRQFLTAEEIEQIETRREALAARAATQADSDAANRSAPPSGTGNPGGYNEFWMEQGAIGDARRTSHIVYPLNGRLPSRVEGAQVQRGGLGPDIPGDRPVRYTVGGIAKDGPEDRGAEQHP